MKVSVLTITYNHEKYIAQVIESVLMQEVNFDYELVIGEDCSTDKTREIVVDYQKKYPHKIRLLLNEKNLGMIRNFVQTYNACRGQHIALLEGDDYWTSPQKLQKQVDFLDSHRDFAICFHNMQIIYEAEERKTHLSNVTQKEVSTIEDLFKCNFIRTASCMFRNNLFSEFPEWFYKLSFADWSLHILNAEYGKIMYLDEVMGVYRVHRGGVWSGETVFGHKSKLSIDIAEIGFLKFINRHLNYKYRNNIWEALVPLYISVIKELITKGDCKRQMLYFKQLRIIDKHFNYKYKNKIREAITPHYVSLIDELIYKDNRTNARFYIVQVLKLGFWKNVSIRYLIVFLLWLFSPNIYQILKSVARVFQSFKRRVFNTMQVKRRKILSQAAYVTSSGYFLKPQTITFDITDRCLLCCKTCNKWLTKGEKKELDTESWKKIILVLKEWLGDYSICISGGELFLRNDIFEIISFARKQNIYVTAVSNGYHIDAELTKKILASGLNGISITLNGIKPETHDFTRGVTGSYEKALLAIDLLNNFKKNMFVAVATVLMEQNKQEVIDLIKFIKNKNIDGIAFQAIHDTSSFRPFDYNHRFQRENTWYVNHPLWPDNTRTMLSVIDEIIEYKRKGYAIGNSFESLLWMKRYFQNPREMLKIKCMVGINNFSIDPYGETRLCFNMDSIGNILWQKPKQIWNSKKAVQQRKAIKACNNTCRILGCNFDDK